MNQWVFAVVSVFALGAPAATAQSVICPSFEVCTPQTTLPTVTGVWGGDVTQVVGAQGGITPSDGALMLRLLTTAPTDSSTGGGPSGGSGSDVYQLVDLTPILADVQTGKVIVKHWADYNRVQFDAQTDTRFAVSIRAYDGAPSSFKTGPTTVKPALDLLSEELFSDSDTATWERIGVQLLLPLETTFIAVYVGASENIFNDFSGAEFDGHYVDNVETLFILTCPGDLNADGVVDGADLAELLAAWGSGGVPADLDMSGTVDGADLAALLASWGACT